MPALRIEGVSKHFGGTRALANVNLEVRDGAFCVVLGPSGCGKSTLLNIVAGLEEADEGKVYLGERDMTGLPPHRRNIAMVFQDYALYPHLSVFENIAFGLRVRREPEDEIRAKVRAVAGILGIEDKLDAFPRELSGGQRQRVATGRAMVREPELFLFDEPLSNLDARLRLELRGELIELHRRLGKTILYVTHDQVEAMSLGETVVVLRDGEVQQVSAPRELYDEPRNLFVAGFIGSPPMNLLKLEVAKTAGSILLAKGDLRFEAPPEIAAALEVRAGEEIHFGFRPSAAKLAEGGAMRGEVVYTESIGEDGYARVRVSSAVEVTVRVSDPGDLRPRQAVSIAIDGARVHLFDAGGRRIPPP